MSGIAIPFWIRGSARLPFGPQFVVWEFRKHVAWGGSVRFQEDPETLRPPTFRQEAKGEMERAGPCCEQIRHSGPLVEEVKLLRPNMLLLAIDFGRHRTGTGCAPSQMHCHSLPQHLCEKRRHSVSDESRNFLLCAFEAKVAG